MLVIFQLRSDLGDVLLGCLIMAGRRHFGPPAIVQLVLPEAHTSAPMLSSLQYRSCQRAAAACSHDLVEGKVFIWRVFIKE